MYLLRASSHQGATSFQGQGKQCVAMSIEAIQYNYSSPPRFWDTDDIDNILHKGDKTYMKIAGAGQYLSFTDIPTSTATIGQSYHGLINGETDKPFFSLSEAINLVLGKHVVSGCLFCMGQTTPSYGSAILKNDSNYYFFDSHSRDESGMMSVDGTACVSEHKSLRDLCQFINSLAMSLDIQNAPFEIAKVNFPQTPIPNCISSELSDSSFSCFEEMSDGEMTCNLYLAEEHINEVRHEIVYDISEESDIDSVGQQSIPEAVDEQIDQYLNNLDDSTIIINDINCSVFDQSFNDQDPNSCVEQETVCNENIMPTDSSNESTELNDENYYPDEESDYSSDDNIPLAHYFNNKRKPLGAIDSNVNGHTESQPSSPIESRQNEYSSANLAISDFQNTNTRKRSRKSKPETWKRNVNKMRLNSGKDYVGKGNIHRSPKKMKLTCGVKCRYQCNSKVSDPQRERIFHMFWRLSSIDKQRQFLSVNAVKKSKQSKSHSKEISRRSFSIDWFLPVESNGKIEKVKVCKTCFLGTLGISDKMISTVHKKINPISVCTDDRRGKHSTRPNRIDVNSINNVREHIRSFKTVESHYCRKDSSKLYLPADLTLSRMYHLYKEKCLSINTLPVKLCRYRYIFKTDFNLSFYRPKKDQCDLCFKFENATPEQKEGLKKELERHVKNKDLARAQKDKDKFMAKSNSDGNLCVCCFDLEQILLTPHGFQSSLYYKRRLCSFNFTIYDMASSDGYCYLWNESTAKRGACEIASCLFNFIKGKANAGIKNFIFYSDNCVAQNKNKFYISMLWYSLKKFGLNSITHRYLEKGHTQNEGDSMHSSVEKASRNIPIYTTDQWAAVIRGARQKQPYRLTEMTLRDFLDFKKLSCNIKNFDINTENEKVYWNGIKVIKLVSSSPDCFVYKNDHDGQDFTVDLFHRSRSTKPDPQKINISQLRDDFVPIPKSKYMDLLSLCENNIIPRAYHAFYLLLPYE